MRAGLAVLILSGSLSLTNGCSGDKTYVVDDPRSLSPLAFQFTGGVRGCGDFVAYRFTDDDTKAVGVRVDKLGLGINERPQRCEMGKTEGLEVFIDDFGSETYEWRAGYCFDAVRPNEGPTTRFQAIKGQATIHVSDSAESPKYEVNILLKDVSFVSDDGSIQFEIPIIELRDVYVGWIPG